MQLQPVQAPRLASPHTHIGAFLLIAIGILALIGNLAGGQFMGGLVVLAMGVAFAAAYVVSRKYGFLVPAGILGGLGGGVFIGQVAGATNNDLGIYAVLGSGTGFLLVYAVDAIVRGSLTRFWPVIPAAVMFLAAGGMVAGNEGFVKTLGQWSPIVLIVIGVWLLIVRARPARS